ncbi:uncharacterized protein LOC142767672 [Rhipicephalus microplus]|uniref:uncharacterized protein LOC142767672 n=1 Tax=Rhipicephalus microplus TaxID=6941 RepID=UPI003F6BF9C2
MGFKTCTEYWWLAFADIPEVKSYSYSTFAPRFIYVEVQHSGSESDGGIFSRCNLQKNILQGALGLPPVSTVGNEGPLPYFFLGDEAFPLKEYVMRPYARRTLHEDDDKSYERRVFNYRMSRARRTIENTFGNLARRWRVLR